MPSNLTNTERAEIIREQSPIDAADVLAKMSPEDIRAILAQLSTDQVVQVASHLADSVEPEDVTTKAIMAEVEESVGELMKPAPAVLPVENSVAEALSFLVKSPATADIEHIFVTRDRRLVGVVTMRDLVMSKPSETLGAIMTPDPVAFRTDTSIQEAMGDALTRHSPIYPVIDGDRQVVGIVHDWELYERVAWELSGQAGSQYGVAREEQISTSVFDAFRMRHPWLQVNLITAFAAAFVVGMFEDTIAQVVALAVFLPVLAGQSGNTGCQALAITLRGITLGQMRDYPVRRLLRKEILLGALNGALVGVIAGIAMFGYALASGSASPVMLGLVIFVAMIGACMGSGIFGVVVPLALKRFGADPATASSIFLTTFTDIIGMGLMLFLATMLIL